MPTPVLFLQGAGEGAHRADAALADSLGDALGPGYHVHYPLMPNEADPDRQAWIERIGAEVTAMGEGGIVVAHSAGGVLLLAALVEASTPRTVAGVFLIAAPFVGNGGWEVEGFAFPADLGSRLPQELPFTFYHSHDDETVPFAHAALYARAVPAAAFRSVKGRDHQFNDDLQIVAEDVARLCRTRSQLGSAST